MDIMNEVRHSGFRNFEFDKDDVTSSISFGEYKDLKINVPKKEVTKEDVDLVIKRKLATSFPVCKKRERQKNKMR